MEAIHPFFTLWQRWFELHESCSWEEVRQVYHEARAQYAILDTNLGLYIVVPQQVVVEVSNNVHHIVRSQAGKSLKKFHELVCPDCHEIRLTYFILIFASVHFVLSHLPNFHSITIISLAAAVMSLLGPRPNVSYELRGRSTSANVLNFFGALGDIAFAYAGHNVVLEIQATIPSTPEQPSTKPMWKGVVFAYIIVAICYLPISLVCYYIFGNSVDDNVLLTLQKPTWLIASANVYAMPVFDMMETFLVKKMKFSPSFLLRFTTRTLYVGKASKSQLDDLVQIPSNRTDSLSLFS
ncbi:UNVERIFIED_CONTAM: Lysine histidine transporter-like 2 [Sesamum angustifolium]|uniref:Lysine histidine transporter-like 2 n=1 Tax=Sesamum angustifolium TaxID=2727405 RepID=A0AAW2M837_9LAMI